MGTGETARISVRWKMIIAIIVGAIDVLFFWSAARIASKADDGMRK